MTALLIVLYNVVLNKSYYLELEQNIVVVILEKGKGPQLGKLRTIMLICKFS